MARWVSLAGDAPAMTGATGNWLGRCGCLSQRRRASFESWLVISGIQFAMALGAKVWAANSSVYVEIQER
jgi:hypothetical protein